MKIITLIISAILFMSANEVSTDNWKSYKFKKAGFSMSFPVKPEDSKKEKGSKTTYKIKAKDGIYTYSITAVDYGKRIDQISGLDTKSLDAFVKGLKGTIDEQSTYKIKDNEGIEAKVTTAKGGKINYRVICIGNFHYQIMVITAKEYAKASEVSKFFDSFEVL